MTESLPAGPVVVWYGDDFTGSAACMEVMTFAGLPSVLFLDIPTPAQRTRFSDARGIGIAGVARSQAPAWMDENLPQVFGFLGDLKAPVSHYKVCSTLDSAPHVGSIGRAIDLATPVFGSIWIPVLIAAPAIRRWQAFGNLFAAAPEGVFRLDRHPVMTRHPVTPMDEADVCAHLAKQTSRRFGLVDLEQLQSNPDAAFDAACAGGAQIIALDCVGEETLAASGRLIWERRGNGIFVVGSQGVQYALVAHFRRAGLIDTAPTAGSAGHVSPMITVSGSVSPVTGAQIDWALSNGFEGIPFGATAAVDDATLAQEEQRVVAAALNAIDAGRDPLVFTARGPGDPTVAEFRAAVSGSQLSPTAANERVGATLGNVVDRVSRTARIKRLVISGGDTSGHATRRLQVYALTALAPTVPGAALLKTHSEDPMLDGIEIALKGGQMGTEDYFGWIRDGGGMRN